MYLYSSYIYYRFAIVGRKFRLDLRDLRDIQNTFGLTLFFHLANDFIFTCRDKNEDKIIFLLNCNYSTSYF